VGDERGAVAGRRRLAGRDGERVRAVERLGHARQERAGQRARPRRLQHADGAEELQRPPQRRDRADVAERGLVDALVHEDHGCARLRRAAGHGEDLLDGGGDRRAADRRRPGDRHAEQRRLGDHRADAAQQVGDERRLAALVDHEHVGPQRPRQVGVHARAAAGVGEERVGVELLDLRRQRREQRRQQRAV